MENPCRTLWDKVWLVLLGVAIGSIPGLIELDQMRQRIEVERVEQAKLNTEATKQLIELRDALAKETQNRAAEKIDCQNAILGDGARTILIDTNHPYGPPSWNLFGASVTFPPPAARVAVGPIWVIPRKITPHVVDGILGGVYTHIWPDGRTDGWQVPRKAE